MREKRRARELIEFEINRSAKFGKLVAKALDRADRGEVFNISSITIVLHTR